MGNMESYGDMGAGRYSLYTNALGYASGIVDYIDTSAKKRR
jgi:hypothetical protein